MSSQTHSGLTGRRRLGEWLPSKEAHLAAYRTEVARAAFVRAERLGQAPRNRSVQDLQALVHDDAVLRMDLTRAIDDAINAGFVLGYQSIDELMIVIDYMLTYAPPFSETSLIHCPINALLDWPMCMPSGYALFRDEALNAQLRRVLNDWSGFLSGPHSREHLTMQAPHGWFCPEADRWMGLEQFIHDRDKPYYGFASWNAFFTRQFRDGVRPVASPDDHRTIVSACEAAPYNIQRDVKLHDRFWLKTQPYSLAEMFGDQQLDVARCFEGGDVYQAFLSAFNYHRWHAPVSGTVTHAYRVDGTYYSDVEAEGVDPGGLNDSQGYIAAVATRAVLVIDCDAPEIGQVACLFVGMADVSSCVIDALPGQHVKKGDELGFFQYGGSTCCLVFRPGVIGTFLPEAPFSSNAQPVKVNAPIALARQQRRAGSGSARVASHLPFIACGSCMCHDATTRSQADWSSDPVAPP